MKRIGWIGLMVLGLQMPAPAAFVFYNDNLNVTVPDYFSGLVEQTLVVSGVLPGEIADVNVLLEIAGGFNGDLYGFVHHAGQTAILLNRVGRSAADPSGYSDRGLGPGGGGVRFRLDDQAAANVHWYRAHGYALNGNGQVTGVWQPDGRELDPEAPGPDFETTGPTLTLGGFTGMDPNGEWTLVLLDASSSWESVLVGWGVEVTPVPEPSVGAVLNYVGLGLGLAGGAVWRVRRRLNRRQETIGT